MPEHQTTEYKSSWHDDYLDWICGFANAQGGIERKSVSSASSAFC
jgi:ATP-dependent DNA helicase RecG